MEPNRFIPVSIPDDLDEVIFRGIDQGRKKMMQRRRIKRLTIRSVGSLAAVFCILFGGVNLSPAFASAIEDVPVLGHLVQIFGDNQSIVQGGISVETGTATLIMERREDTELMQLLFQQEEASLYKAEFSSYPKTITVTLPGTTSVQILSEISRAKDTSQYIKSVYQLPTSTQDTSAIQLELESDANVQISEYGNPGSLVICLTPAPSQLDTIYSVRTLSFDEQDIQTVSLNYSNNSFRLLRDDSNSYFLEFAQYSTLQEAQVVVDTLPGDVIIESRTGNNVPVSYFSMEDYEKSQMMDAYYQLLRSSSTVDPILNFLDQYFPSAASSEQDIMLSGLWGFLEDSTEEEVID
ncbi:MAG: DUF4179 domain-containing protein [Lawsonibacter sp.]|jgi:hypothetical protein